MGQLISASEIRAAALALPEAEEHSDFDKPSFRVRNKIFAVIQPDGVSLLVKAERDDIVTLTGSEPDIFSTPKGFGHLNYMLVRLDRIGKPELQRLLVQAWRCVAPKPLAAQLDADAAGGTA